MPHCLPQVFEAWRWRHQKRNLCERGIRPVRFLRGFVLHHLNANAYTAAATTDSICINGVHLVLQPPYSPDRTPCDWFLFLHIKKKNKKQSHWTRFGMPTLLSENSQRYRHYRRNHVGVDWYQWFERMAMWWLKGVYHLKGGMIGCLRTLESPSQLWCCIVTKDLLNLLLQQLIVFSQKR